MAVKSTPKINATRLLLMSGPPLAAFSSKEVLQHEDIDLHRDGPWRPRWPMDIYAANKTVLRQRESASTRLRRNKFSLLSVDLGFRK
jgi:hypothetical protein